MDKKKMSDEHHDEFEMAYKNGFRRGYRKGYADAMDEKSTNGTGLCEKCVCARVCNTLKATGGVTRCGYFHAEDVYAEVRRTNKPVKAELDEMCMKCGCHLMHKDCVCPGCGAILKREEQCFCM